jgi:hypothetical protein
MFTAKIWSGQDIQFSKFTSQKSSVQAIFPQVTMWLWTWGLAFTDDESHLLLAKLSQILLSARNYAPHCHTALSLQFYYGKWTSQYNNISALWSFMYISLALSMLLLSVRCLCTIWWSFPDRQAFSWSDLI